MSHYLYKCPVCGKEQQKYSSILNRPKPLVCKDCECDMEQFGIVESKEIINEKIQGDFDFVCPECAKTLHLNEQPDEVPYCHKCDCYMDRILKPYKQFGIGNKVYYKSIHSDSLAIMPSQVEEHKKVFPDVSIDNEGRPILTSVKQHDDYINKIGAVKQTQKIKVKGKRIA